MTDPRQPEATAPHVPASEPSGDTTRPRSDVPAGPDKSTRVRSAAPVFPPALTAAPAAPPGERYRFGKELARGGMGVVSSAEDLVLGREVAVKVLAAGLSGTDDARRFVEEARITAQLQHPSIPPIHDLGTLPDGRPFLAMKLINGKTLAKKLDERGSPAEDLDDFAGIFEQVCQAVAFAHSKGIIHRDLKPANIMVGAFGEVQVMDWGLAKSLREPDRNEVPANDPVEGPEDRTRAGSVMGTPAYMPPEQARGEPVDARADVFALGGILCAILTGKAPYTGTLGWIVLQKAAAADLGEADTRLRNAIDGFAGQVESGGASPLVGLARHCLNPDADKRPDHAGVVAAMIHSARERTRRYLRDVELGQAVADSDRAASTARRVLGIALGTGSVVLACAAVFIASRPLGDFAAMGVVFGLAFAGVLAFALLTRER